MKPRRLRPGATLGIISPASTPRPELVRLGMEALQRRGYGTKLFPHALDRGPLYYAGTLEDRLRDFHAAFEDAAVDGIICTRGGWGSAELLPHLRRDLIRANAKPFLGYSDHTSLHVWLRNEAEMVTFQGPMVAADWSRMEGPDYLSWDHVLGGSKSWSVGVEEGLRVLRPGCAQGELSGGCVSIFAEAIGTPSAPHARGGILFLEDIGTKPYQWDRMLLHLRYAGLLEGVQGIVFGDMRQCCTAEEMPLMEGALLHALDGFLGPIAIGLRSGHVSERNVTLPFGVEVRLDCEDVVNPRMHFLESAVQG